MDACAGYAGGLVTYDQLISTAVKFGFNNVLDAFQNQTNFLILFRSTQKLLNLEVCSILVLSWGITKG